MNDKKSKTTSLTKPFNILITLQHCSTQTKNIQQSKFFCLDTIQKIPINPVKFRVLFAYVLNNMSPTEMF